MPSGNIRKMTVELATPVNYQLPIGNELLPMNPLIGKTLRIAYDGLINCVNCGRKSKKSFHQGHCFPCMRKLASCDMCIVRPETCHHHLGTCREPEWGTANCMVDHTVYLSNSSGLKVGITRGTQVPTRWIDQGAVQALAILNVKTRLDAGLAEVKLAQYVADKSDWRKLITQEPQAIDLVAAREALFAEANVGDGSELGTLLNDESVDISYPVERYLAKAKTQSLDKSPVVEGTLLGIRGQYLLLDTGAINVRKFTGYHIEISVH
jgi:hypothetical protein